MTIERYVDHTNGDDTWTGEHATNDPVGTGPKKHLQATIDSLTEPITEECKIYLAGSPTAEGWQSYGLVVQEGYPADPDADTDIDLENLRIEGDGELIIQPTIWDNDDYEAGQYPFSGFTGDFDPKGQKPCLVPCIKMKHTKKITIRGVEIARTVTSDSPYSSPAVVNQLSADIHLHYCTVSDFLYGPVVMCRGDLNIFNCYFKDNIIGVVALDGGGLGLFGNNFIENCSQFGILAANNSVVTIRNWDINPLKFYTTRIYTTETRRNYAAIKAMVNSTIQIGSIPMIGDYEKPVLVQILNEKEFNTPDYFGVVLESGALLVGGKYLAFAGKDSSGNELNRGKPTVTEGQRLAVAPSEGCIITD